MKKICAAVFLFLVMATGWGLGSHAAENMQWKIGHVRPQGSAIDQDIQRLVQHISQETDGEISFTVYPANKLGDYTVVQEKCAFGEVEMYIGPFGTMMNKKNALAFTPYLVTNWDQARKVYAHDSVLMQEMEKILLQQNIQILGGWPVYFGGLVSAKKPPSPHDPDVSKEMIIRVPPIRCFSLTAEALGYTPYPITWMFARDGLRTGMVEGMLGGGAEGYLGLQRDVAKYYLHIKDHFEHWFVYINRDVWDNLSPENQEIIQEAVLDMERRRFAVAEKKEQQNMRRLSEQGTTLITFSKPELKRIRDKVRDEVWTIMQEEIGKPFEDVVSSLPD
ncbi:MAG: TRAP transporter substrate-binding protein DctP [Desulfovermiculus sp.]|nr:TRAP transporter substrate-binding protein DctP [Desulfovermiculus sp.]